VGTCEGVGDALKDLTRFCRIIRDIGCHFTRARPNYRDPSILERVETAPNRVGQRVPVPIAMHGGSKGTVSRTARNKETRSTIPRGKTNTLQPASCSSSITACGSRLVMSCTPWVIFT
jgi:hypothetical protein